MFSPRVWSRFSANKKRKEYVNKFIIQDATVDQKEEIRQIVREQFINIESYNIAAGIHKSEEAKRERLILWESRFSELLITVCCEDNGSGAANPIIGISMMSLKKKDDPNIVLELSSQVKTPEGKKLFAIVSRASNLCDVFNELGVDKYYQGRGVIVQADYRGLGIATEFLKVRRMICKEHNVPATVAWMTAVGSQKAAERAGWKTLFQIPFDELVKPCGCDCDGGPPMCKLMVDFQINKESL